MYTSLNPGAIGVNVSTMAEGLALAARHGFDGYHFNIAEAVGLGVERVKELAEAEGVRLSAFGFPLDFRGEEDDYEDSLDELDALAAAAAALDVRRTATWIAPASDELTFEENFELHARRLRPAAEILAAHGIRLGLEYVGPLRSRQGKKHPFVHTMDQMAKLCAAIGPNAGFLLDAWHWYTASEDSTHLQRLQPEQVVDVHVNDAPDLAVDA
ncbi:MAG: TIM barrel protein, partial [Gemmatimonadetes bacterium]|nr:TIM barrel protein [Gemmatimonadota bacterium]